MKKLPPGYIIDNPHDLIYTNFYLSENTINVLNIIDKNNKVYFTRLSLKHLSEKHDGEYIINRIKEILESPDRIFVGIISNRFLISKMINFKSSKKAHIVTIEITEKNKNIVITGFISKETYFKNLRLLWGTTSPHLNS